jgi:signal transduction histidine kinase
MRTLLLCCALVLGGTLLAPARGAEAPVQEAMQAQMLVHPAETAPDAGAAWQAVPLPDLWPRSRPEAEPAATWYRIAFDVPHGQTQPWAGYFPYLYEGGDVWVNGALAARILASSDSRRVRWIRPHLVLLPPALLTGGRNELMVRVPIPRAGAAIRFPRVVTGPAEELRAMHDRRFFWTTITPQITFVVCLLTSLCVLFIWWRRPGETMYGLFGVAVLLWGVRTLNFVVEVVPWSVWLSWRMVLHAATGGFIVAMTMLAWRMAGIRQRWFERALIAYWLVGPVWMLAQGASAEPLVNRYWIGGMLPIGATIVGVSAWSLVRRRTLETAALPVTMAIAALAGMNDYMVAWELDPAFLRGWSIHRLNLMHVGADLVLVAMGGLLTARFVRSLRSVELMNQTLESRVADREKELIANYARMAALESAHAASQERQRIMREIHDGMGSQLFVSLSRLERGELDPKQTADALRGCIAEMRLALDTLAPQELDFRSTLGNFLFRWRNQLIACGIRPSWDIAVPDEDLQVSPHAALQLLRVAQEALTNVVKHAHATAVDVQLRLQGGELALEVRDNGVGAAAGSGVPGHGVGNMRVRAEQLGGHLDVGSAGPGTRVTVHVPLQAVRA